MWRLAQTMILGSLVLTACQPPRLSPVATRRYLQATMIQDTLARSADITAFSLPVPNSDPNGILSLTPPAQAEFVRAVAAHTNTASALAAGLAAPIRDDAPPPGTRNLARISRRVVFSVENRSMGMADRLQQVRIRLQLPQGISYVSWDKIATKHNTVDVGTLTFTQGAEVGAELGLTLPVLGAAPKVTSSASSGLDENVTLRQRLVELNGALTEREAVLYQQSAAGLDLTGNVIADFVMEVRPGHAEWFYAFAGREENACTQRPGMRGEFNWISSDTMPDTATVVLEYLLRRVDSGHATITESDDVVAFVSARQERHVELIPQSALFVYAWVVRIGPGLENVLELRSEAGGMGLERRKPVQFASYEDAERIVLWLRRCSGVIPGFQVSIGGRAPNLGRLYIDRVKANTDPVDR